MIQELMKTNNRNDEELSYLKAANDIFNYTITYGADDFISLEEMIDLVSSRYKIKDKQLLDNIYKEILSFNFGDSLELSMIAEDKEK